MTVSVTSTVNTSVGNGVTTVFPYAFRILAAADLEVSVDGVVKTLGVDYTVSGVGSGSGGNVTFTVAPATGATVIRRRDMALVRTTDYQDNGDLLADVLNPDQDAAVMMLQQVQEQVDRAPKAPLGEAAIGNLPAVATRKNKTFVFNDGGDPAVAATPESAQWAVDQALIYRNAASASAAAAAVSQGAAAGSAGSASADRVAADTAATLSAVTGKIFQNTTDGLANTSGSGTTNRYFWVPLTGTTDTLQLYLNNGGAAVLKGTFTRTYTDTSIGGGPAFTYTGGEVPGYYDEQGQLRLMGNARGVDQRLDDMRALAYYGAGLALGLKCESNTTAYDSVLTAAIAADSKLAGSAWASEQFRPYEENYPAATDAWRFPTLLQLSPGRLLLFVGNILKPVGVDDIHACRIMVADVTFNFKTKSFTVGTQRTVVDNRAFTSGANVAYAVGQTPVLVRSGPNKGRIYLLFSSNKDDPASIPHEKPYLTYSDDSGVTWSAPVGLAAATGTFDNTYGFATGMRGIQLKFGANRGRLLMPWYANTAASKTQCFSVYSDDGGVNWSRGTPFGSVVGSGITEPSFAEHPDGTVYAVARGDSTAVNNHQLWKSTDGGVTFTLVNAALVTDNNVQASMVQLSDSTPNVPAMVIAWPNSTADRSHMTVALSYDGWATKTNKELDIGNSGYSTVEAVGEDYVMVAWEKQYYPSLFANTIVLQAMNRKYITG